MPKRGRSHANDASLEKLAARAGVLTQYVSGLGGEARPPASAIRALCAALATEPGASLPPPIVVDIGDRALRFDLARSITRRGQGRLLLEDGGEIPVTHIGSSDGAHRVQLRNPIPLGVHELMIEHGAKVSRRYVLARPRTLKLPTTRAGRRLAVFLPLYAVTPGGPFGVGCYTDLRELCTWADRVAGALVATLPLFPAFLDRPFDPSPYAPITRLMWNELFIDPRETPEWAAIEVRTRATSLMNSGSTTRTRTGPLVDYRNSWSVARRVLHLMAAAARSSPSRWADVLSRAVDPTAVDMYLYAQTVASAQITAIQHSTRSHNPLYLDLPVGIHAHGFDTFTRPDLFLHGVSAGAPPDPLNAHGQDWGFPPMHPTAGRADGYAHLRALLRRMLSVSGVLRIDHVMGLYRMFCIPKAHDGSQGAYVRYPEDELFAIVMIEAARAGATVVGEDLGTVPPPVRSIMKRSGILGTHVQQFAIGDKPGACIQPAGAHVLASLNTHDTPTFAGFWRGDDVTLRQALGHTDKTGAVTELAGRSSMRRAIAGELRTRRLPTGSARDAAMSLMRLQARGPSPITLVNLEDLWGERQPQNVPGTSTEYPNWRRRASRSLTSILSDAEIKGALSTLRRDRRRRAAKGRS